MITVDTNIIVRLLTQDDQLQYQQSLKIFQSQNIFISNTVILETEWVLYTFDEKFIKKASELTQCKVLKPHLDQNNG